MPWYENKLHWRHISDLSTALRADNIDYRIEMLPECSYRAFIVAFCAKADKQFGDHHVPKDDRPGLIKHAMELAILMAGDTPPPPRTSEQPLPIQDQRMSLPKYVQSTLKSFEAVSESITMILDARRRKYPGGTMKDAADLTIPAIFDRLSNAGDLDASEDASLDLARLFNIQSQNDLVCVQEMIDKMVSLQQEFVERLLENLELETQSSPPTQHNTAQIVQLQPDFRGKADDGRQDHITSPCQIGQPVAQDISHSSAKM
jgi:hypothetical protein